MSFSPCLVIPCYNHGATLGRTVEALVPHGLPIFVVDDGSDAATQAALREIAARQPLVRLTRLPVNGGKGAAVMAGLRQALAAGHSHALQIDADGQHDTADVARFLACGAARQGAVICGKPVYDASVPRSRLYGRYLTHVWVWVETLSFAIGDSMCGFRLYPLAETVALLDRSRIATRMDFDIEIIVRLAWAGLPIKNLATRVTYPPGGLSHFDLLRDNLRISGTHTRLVLGMLWRAPWLLGRRLFNPKSSGGKPCIDTQPPLNRRSLTPDPSPGGRGELLPSPSGRRAGDEGTMFPGHDAPRYFGVDGRESTHWSRYRERGASWGLALTFACHRLLGDRAALALLTPVVGYFFLTGGAARHASLDYLRRLAAYAPEADTPAPTWGNAFRHMLAFARAGIDKVSAWTGRLSLADVDFPDRPRLRALMASGRGAVLIGSHLGNIETARALSGHDRVGPINAVVYSDHAQRFARVLELANARFGVNLIQVSALGPDTAILLREKIDRGELLVIVGDRTPPAENGRVSRVDFLGSPAPFAQGPFILASLLDCPVYLFFSLREGRRYRIHLEPFAERIDLPRAERQARLTQYAQRYAERLGAYCLKAPLQWFNFYDFWRADAAAERH